MTHSSHIKNHIHAIIAAHILAYGELPATLN